MHIFVILYCFIIWKTGGYFFPCYTYVCSVMRSYCPAIFLSLGLDPPIFDILGLNFKCSYQIASLFDMYIYMVERIAGKQDMHILIIEDPLSLPPPPNSPKYFVWHFGPYMKKTGFQIVSPCCTYVSTVMRSAFAEISVNPCILCKGPTWPRQKSNKNVF